MIQYVIFDFGNVIGSFDAKSLIRRFCGDEADCALLQKAVFHDWAALDAGKISYADAIARALELLPARLHGTARSFFRDWYRHMPYVAGMPELIAELKGRGIPLYLLSNASVYFAEHLEEYEALQGFAGIVVSGVLQMVKPEPGLYAYLLEKYALLPEECLFIDDLEANIEAARGSGMQGYIFDGDTARLRAYLFPRLDGSDPGRCPLAKQHEM